MWQRLALGFLACALIAGCESGRGGGGGGHSSFGGGGSHGWGGSSSSASSSGSTHGSSSSSSSSSWSGSSRPSLTSSSRTHDSSDGVGVGGAALRVLPTVAEALLVGGGNYDVTLDPDEPANPGTPIADPCESCPLEDPCGRCVGFGHAACRINTSGFMARCESSR